MKGIFEIKMDYALKFDVDQKTINTIQKKFAKQSYYFAVALNDEKQIELADRILKNEENLSIKFKIVQLLRYCKLGRFLVKIKIKQQ